MGAHARRRCLPAGGRDADGDHAGGRGEPQAPAHVLYGGRQRESHCGRTATRSHPVGGEPAVAETGGRAGRGPGRAHASSARADRRRRSAVGRGSTGSGSRPGCRGGRSAGRVGRRRNAAHQRLHGAGRVPAAVAARRRSSGNTPPPRSSCGWSTPGRCTRSCSAATPRSGSSGPGATISSLEHEPFAEDEIVLVAAPGACPDELTLDALSGYPLVSREEGSGTQASVADRLRAAGFAPAQSDARLTLGSTQAVMSAVREGAGVGFVSWFAAKPQIDCGLLQLVRLPELRLTRTLWLVYERGRATGALRTRLPRSGPCVCAAEPTARPCDSLRPAGQGGLLLYWDAVTSPVRGIEPDADASDRGVPRVHLQDRGARRSRDRRPSGRGSGGLAPHRHRDAASSAPRGVRHRLAAARRCGSPPRARDRRGADTPAPAVRATAHRHPGHAVVPGARRSLQVRARHLAAGRGASGAGARLPVDVSARQPHPRLGRAEPRPWFG